VLYSVAPSPVYSLSTTEDAILHKSLKHRLGKINSSVPGSGRLILPEDNGGAGGQGSANGCISCHSVVLVSPQYRPASERLLLRFTVDWLAIYLLLPLFLDQNVLKHKSLRSKRNSVFIFHIKGLKRSHTGLKSTLIDIGGALDTISSTPIPARRFKPCSGAHNSAHNGANRGR
jgi:hypothetical protein